MYYTLASVATLLVIAISWRVLSSKHSAENKSLQHHDASQVTEADNDSKKSSNSEDSQDIDVDDLLIKSSEIEKLEPQEIAKLQEGSGDSSPSKKVKETHAKRVRAKQLEDELAKSMTEDQLDEERRVRQSQLEAIFKLMQDNQDRFGVDSMEDVQSQYKLYA